MKKENKYTYKKVKEEKLNIIEKYADKLRFLIEFELPDSREKSLAVTKLEESVMWAKACIERNCKGNEDDYEIKEEKEI